MKIFSVIEPQHCGSTMVFNTARGIAVAAGVRVHSCWSESWRSGPPIPPCELLLLKDHGIPNDLILPPNQALVPIRHPVDALLTHICRYSTHGFEESQYKDWAIDYCSQIQLAQQLAVPLISYEFCAHNRIAGVAALARLMGLTIHDYACSEVVSRVDRIRDNPLAPQDDLTPEFREAAVNNPIYNITLTTRAHCTAGGAVDKWMAHVGDEWYADVVSNEQARELIELSKIVINIGVLSA